MASHIPSVGTRFSHNEDFGTIKYVGPVENTRGLWLGVEWDNPDRGKHDGCKDGKLYFSCQYKTSGSFIRPSPHIQYGVSFLHALSARYVEALHGSGIQEKVTLGSSQGAIQVEAVSLDKIRAKFSRLDLLREVSLEKANVVQGDLPGEISNTCANVRGLDLSQNLLPCWETVSQIAQELPLLQRLSLNRMRLQLPVTLGQLAGSFRKLTEIHLNATLINWIDMQTVTSCMPLLRVIEMGYNQLTRLGGNEHPNLSNFTVEVLNLDSNLCSDWTHICTSLGEYKALERVVLTSNDILNIPFPGCSSDCLHGVKYLSLTENHINSWESIDALSFWLPSLETLTMGGNPLMNDDGPANQSRPLLIARVPSLMTLDGATITPRERTDSEIFYMSTIIQQGIVTDEVRAKAHPHWKDLCEKHGKPDELRQQQNLKNTLSNHLIDLQLYRYDESMERNGDAFQCDPETVIRILPTMTLRILRLKTCKTLKYDARNTDITLWLRMGHGFLTRLEKDQDSRGLDWLGVESGSQVIYQVKYD